MSSGLKNVVINTAERAISTDINRLQSFAAKGLMEAYRFMLDVQYGGDDDQAASNVFETITPTAPMTGEILGGLLVVPQIGTLLVGISDGILFCIDPDVPASTDDSPYKYVQDAGGLPTTTSTPTAAPLQMTANATSDIRIDVIECSRVPDPDAEFDNRDIFNPVTGLFTASTVQKTADSVLQYRVRTGTPGAGFPGVVTEWLPLAVASVPAGTTTNDTITFWDVRPFVADRVYGTYNIQQDLSARTRMDYQVNYGGASKDITNGIVEATYLQWRAGGLLQRGSPGTDYEYIDFSDTANQDAAMNLASAPLVYFYFVYPFALPRWARYTDASAGYRQPRSPRGIPICSTVAPVGTYGVPRGQIVMPAVFGFNGAATSNGVCWGATTSNTLILNPQVTSDGWTTLLIQPGARTGSAMADTGTFTLVEGVDFPPGAVELKVQLKVQISFGVTTTPATFQVTPWLRTIVAGTDSSSPSATYCDDRGGQTTLSAGGANGIYAFVWNTTIELPSSVPSTSSSASYTVTYFMNPTNSGAGGFPDAVAYQTTPTLQVMGWKMGK